MKLQETYKNIIRVFHICNVYIISDAMLEDSTTKLSIALVANVVRLAVKIDLCLRSDARNRWR